MKKLVLGLLAVVVGSGCGGDSGGGGGGGDSPCETNEVPGPNLPGGEVMFTIESAGGVRRVPGKITGTRRGELELRSQCMPLMEAGGHTINLDMDLPQEPGRYDAETPAPGAGGTDEKALEFVSAVYYVEKVAPVDRAGLSFEEAIDAWRLSYGTPGSEVFFTDDFVLELTEVSPFEGDSSSFDVVPHGSVTMTLLPAVGMMVELDPAREPITLTAEF